MQPVRIKLYGLMTLTRRGYLIQLTLCGVLLLALFGLIVWMQVNRLPLKVAEIAQQDNPGPSARLLTYVCIVLDLLPLIAIVLAVFLGIEAVVVLRRFALKEALARARPPEEHSPPKP
jgi:hypothetical protein